MRRLILALALGAMACGASTEKQCENICETFVACGDIPGVNAAQCQSECVDYAAKGCADDSSKLADCIDGLADKCDSATCSVEASMAAQCWVNAAN